MFEDEDESAVEMGFQRKSNTLPIWGNEKTMNLNSLLLTNIQASHYFKVTLFGLKTFHEVVDEIYYNVAHMEPWEKGSRKSSQTGMCGGVRGVGTGGIVSTAFSCLYKMFTLRLTRRQLNGLINHTDSPYIRAVGFLYIRFTQPPSDLFGWFEPYLEDEEPIDVRAGGGEDSTIGIMCRRMLSKLDWYGTLLPRIPVPIEMKIQKVLKERFPVPPPGGRPVVDDRDARRPPRDPAPPNGDYRGREAPRRREEPPPRRAARSPSRDIADEIAMEKERVRREAGGERRGEHRDRRQRSRSAERHRRHQHRERRDKPRRRSRDRRRSRSRESDRRRHRRHSGESRDRRRSGSRDRRGVF